MRVTLAPLLSKNPPPDVASTLLPVARQHPGQHRPAPVALRLPARRVDSRPDADGLRRPGGMAGSPAARAVASPSAGQRDGPAAAPVDASRIRDHGGQRDSALLRDSGAVVPERVLPGEADFPGAGRPEHLDLP